MTHPYSIFVYQAPLSRQNTGHWIEYLQVFNEQYAVYVANLIYNDSHSVIKVVRYGLNIRCFPDEKTVEKIDEHLARQGYSLKRPL